MKVLLSPEKVAMEKMSIQSEKAASGLEQANEQLDKHAKEISALKSAGEKGNFSFLKKN